MSHAPHMSAARQISPATTSATGHEAPPDRLVRPRWLEGVAGCEGLLGCEGVLACEGVLGREGVVGRGRGLDRGASRRPAATRFSSPNV